MTLPHAGPHQQNSCTKSGCSPTLHRTSKQVLAPASHPQVGPHHETTALASRSSPLALTNKKQKTKKNRAIVQIRPSSTSRHLPHTYTSTSAHIHEHLSHTYTSTSRTYARKKDVCSTTCVQGALRASVASKSTHTIVFASRAKNRRCARPVVKSGGFNPEMFKLVAYASAKSY
jgi:hypothetical protein